MGSWQKRTTNFSHLGQKNGQLFLYLKEKVSFYWGEVVRLWRLCLCRSLFRAPDCCANASSPTRPNSWVLFLKYQISRVHSFVFYFIHPLSGNFIHSFYRWLTKIPNHRSLKLAVDTYFLDSRYTKIAVALFIHKYIIYVRCFYAFQLTLSFWCG